MLLYFNQIIPFFFCLLFHNNHNICLHFLFKFHLENVFLFNNIFVFFHSLKLSAFIFNYKYSLHFVYFLCVPKSTCWYWLAQYWLVKVSICTHSNTMVANVSMNKFILKRIYLSRLFSDRIIWLIFLKWFFFSLSLYSLYDVGMTRCLWKNVCNKSLKKSVLRFGISCVWLRMLISA